MRSSSSFTRAVVLGVLWAFACGPRPGVGAALHLQAPTADRDADLWVDGNYVGRLLDVQAPAHRIQLAPGVHRVEVRKPGRFPVQRTVRVERQADQIVTISVDLLEDPR